MKLNLAVLSALAAVVASKTVYLTNTHIVTVNADGQPVTGSAAPSSAGQASSASSASFLVKTIATDAPVDNKVAANAVPSAQPSSAESAFTSADFTPPSSPTTGGLTETSSSSSAQPSSTDSGSSNLSGFDSEILKAHNDKRAKHSAQSLTWSDKLTQYAEKMANDYQCGSGLKHSGGQYGENLAVGYKDADATVQAWYDEGNNYQYSSNQLNHFTQVIWKGTKELGCAQKQCGSGSYVVCEYYPAGNMMGQEKANLAAN